MHGVHFIEHERENPAARDEARAAVAESEALDAYSTIVASVADRVTPSVTSLRVARRLRGGRQAEGAGSAVILTPDRFALPPAPVVQRAAGGPASFAPGPYFALYLCGRAPPSRLAVAPAPAPDR